MKSSVLGEVYSAFNTKELKELDKYLKNSVWNSSSILIQMHEFYLEMVNNNKWDSQSKEDLYRYIYPNEHIFSDGKLRFIQNRLLGALQEWVILNQLKLDNQFCEKIWRDFIIQKKLKKNIQMDLNKKNDVVTNSENYLLNKYFKSQEASFFEIQFQRNHQEQFDKIIDSINASQEFADLTFLKNYCILLQYQNLYQSKSHELPIEKLEEIKQRYNSNQIVYIHTYILLIDLLTHKKEEDYFHLKKIFLEQINSWHKDEIHAIINYLINYTIQKTNSGNANFIDERYEIYLFLEKQGFFELEGFVDFRTINNVVLIALRKKELIWAGQFLEKYINLLEGDIKLNCYHYNLARIEYEEKKYKSSMRHLLKVEYNQDLFYATNSKLLLMKIYFELNEFEAFQSLALSFKSFIKTNKILSDNYKNAYFNFIKYAKKVYNASYSQKKKLSHELTQNPNIVEKNWLIEKCK
jgi:hypothetical protein